MISKTMVCVFYKATAIYADTEAEQTYCQSNDGNDILCLVLTQVSECYFEIMEYHSILYLFNRFQILCQSCNTLYIKYIHVKGTFR